MVARFLGSVTCLHDQKKSNTFARSLSIGISAISSFVALGLVVAILCGDRAPYSAKGPSTALYIVFVPENPFRSLDEEK